jgi:hypothetical protein
MWNSLSDNALNRESVMLEELGTNHEREVNCEDKNN